MRSYTHRLLRAKEPAAGFLLAAIVIFSYLIHSVLCSSTLGASYDSEHQLLGILGGPEDAIHVANLARAVAAATPSNSSVAGYAYSGCYNDADTSLLALLGANYQYLLNGRSYTSTTAMTWAACTSYCNGFQYAGLTSGSICRCGNSFNFSPTLNSDSLCQTPCTGSILQSCGASNRSTIFRNTNYGSASTAIGAPLSFISTTSTPPFVSSPISTLIGLPLNAIAASSLITPGQPSASTLIGPPLALAPPVPLASISAQTPATQPLAALLAPVLPLLAPVLSTPASIQVASSVTTILPSQQAIPTSQNLLGQLSPLSILIPLLPPTSTSPGLTPSIVPTIASSTSSKLTGTSQAPVNPILPIVSLIPALLPPLSTSNQAPTLFVPLIPSSSTPVASLIALPTSLAPPLVTNLANLASLQSLCALPSGLPPVPTLNLQSPSTTLQSTVSTNTPDTAPFGVFNLSPASSVSIKPLPSPNPGAVAPLAILPVVSNIVQPLQIFGLSSLPTAVAPPIVPPLVATIPSSAQTTIISGQPSLSSPPPVLGVLPISLPQLIPLAATTLGLPPLVLPSLAILPPAPSVAVQDNPFTIFNLPTVDEPSINLSSVPTEPTQPVVLATGTVIAKVYTWTCYSTGLVQVDSTFLSPLTGLFQSSLPDGTRVGLDSSGLYIGSKHRVPYPPEFLPIIAGLTLPPPQLLL